MLQHEKLDLVIIFLTLVTAVICVFILAIFRLCLANGRRQTRKSYAALLIDANENVDMIIPIVEQKVPSLNHYSRIIQTESIHSTVDTNPDYFQSILSNNDQPYYSVREINFSSVGKSPSDMNIDANKGHYLIDKNIDQRDCFRGEQC